MLDSMIKDLWRGYWPTILTIAAITLLIIYIPGKSLPVFILCVLVPILITKLLSPRIKPSVLDWAKTIGISTLWVSGFYFLAKLLGLWGLFGAIIFLAIILGVRLYKARKLLLYTFKWGADYLETGKQKRFRGFAKKYK